MTPSISKLFLIDKPAGVSSFAALGALKKSLGTRKVGHAGTLDPFATGLLLVLSGRMTRTAELLSVLDKEYTTVIRFGEETDTLDTDGTVVQMARVPQLNDIENALTGFQGMIEQVPPVYSAIKVNGKRAYDRARRGMDVQLPARSVRIDVIEITDWCEPDLTVRIRCSKGTYIRSIARDLGLATGSRAHCRTLRRTAIGPFRVERAAGMDMAAESGGISAVECLTEIGIPVFEVDREMSRLLKSGHPLERLPMPGEVHRTRALVKDPDGEAVALVEFNGTKWVYSVVFD